MTKKNKNYTDIIKVLSLKNNGKFQLNINHKEQYKNLKRRNSCKLNAQIFNRRNKINNNSIYLNKSISSQKELLYLQKEK